MYLLCVEVMEVAAIETSPASIADEFTTTSFSSVSEKSEAVALGVPSVMGFPRNAVVKVTFSDIVTSFLVSGKKSVSRALSACKSTSSANGQRMFEAQRASFSVKAGSMKTADTINEAIKRSRVYLSFFAGQELDDQQTAGLRDHLVFLDREFDKSQAKRVAQADAGNLQLTQEFRRRDMDQLIEAGGNLEDFFRKQQARSSEDRFNVAREALFREDPEFDTLMDIALDGARILTAEEFVPSHAS
jgi:hypothetical protein